MRRILMLVAGTAVATAIAGDGIATRHFANFADFAPYLRGGGDFSVRGDTQRMTASRATPIGFSEQPFSLWNNGVPHAFKIVHNAGGVTGIEIDDVYTMVNPVTIDPFTNGLLVTAFASVNGPQVRLSNLKLTRPGEPPKNVNSTASAPATDLLLIKTIDPLSGGFILSGQVTFTWTGDLPPAAEQFFELVSVVVCEPCDVNCDGSVNGFDIQPLIDLLAAPVKNPCSVCAGDTNFNGTINPFDIQGFVECLAR